MGDIIQMDKTEDIFSFSVSLSNTIALINWTNTFCPGAKLVLKCDDDVYINVNNLQREIWNLNAQDPPIYGREIIWDDATWVTKIKRGNANLNLN